METQVTISLLSVCALRLILELTINVNTADYVHVCIEIREINENGLDLHRLRRNL